MATTAGALNTAILARLRGTEVLTGDQLTAQGITDDLTWRLATLKVGAVTYPSGTIWSEPGIDAMPYAVDVGIIEHSVRRFEVWQVTPTDTFFANLADALEMLFDPRRGGVTTLLSPAGDGVLFDSSLLTGMQGPFFDEAIDAWYGLMSFSFVEARP